MEDQAIENLEEQKQEQKPEIKEDIIASLYPNAVVYKVSHTTDVVKLSVAIYKGYLEAKRAKKDFIVRAIGEGAISQSIKGIIRSFTMLSQNGYYINIKPFWMDDQDKAKNGNFNIVGFKFVEIG